MAEVKRPARTIFFTSFEWNHFADKLQIPTLMVKHLLILVLVVWGVFAWKRLKRKVEELRAKVQPCPDL